MEMFLLAAGVATQYEVGIFNALGEWYGLLF